MRITRIILQKPAGLLRIVTDSELEGHCTGVTVFGSDLERVAPILLGSDPVDRERIWWALMETDGGPDPGLRAGIDVALWDLSAKIAGQPLFRHIGGFRGQVPVCRAGLVGDNASEILQEARYAQRAGFRAYRFGMQSDESALAKLISDLRATVGPDFPLIFDGRARYMIDEALRIGRKLDEADYFYFDRPRPQSDHSGGKQVAGEIDTPISAEVSSPLEASQVMTAQSADHIRTGALGAGGFTGVLKSARCTEAFGAYCHLDGTGISDGFAHLHLAAALRNTPFLEMTGQESGLAFIRNPLRLSDGFVQVPDRPGLGMEIDLDEMMESTTELIET